MAAKVHAHGHVALISGKGEKLFGVLSHSRMHVCMDMHIFLPGSKPSARAGLCTPPHRWCPRILALP